MANFDEIKRTAAEKAGTLAGKAAELAGAAAEKTKLMAKVGKLNAEILAEKQAIRKASLELGKIYYEYFKVDPHEPMKEACAKIDAAYAAIAAKRSEIEELKTQTPDVEVEVETEPVEEAAEEVCECVKEAAEEVCDCAKEAVDAAEDAVEKACSCAEEDKPE